jgi:Zn-dependent protease
LQTLADIGWFVLVLGLGVGYFTLSAVLHELGHWMTGRLLGVACTLACSRSGPFVSFATRFSGSPPMTPRQDLLVTSAGVVVQSAITLLILAQSPFPILTGLALISLPLISLNLAPLEPTDGYYVLRAARRMRGVNSELIRILAVLQWLALPASLVTAVGSSIQWLSRLSAGATGASLGLGVLGLTISYRVLHRLRRLYYSPPFCSNEPVG